MQEVHLDKHIKLLDSPGIVLKRTSDDDPSMALRNCVKVNVEAVSVYPWLFFSLKFAIKVVGGRGNTLGDFGRSSTRKLSRVKTF